MKNVFDIWADKLRNLNFMQIVKESIQETLPELEDLQTEQLSLGLLNTGDLIEPDLRSDEYARQKKARGGKAPLFTPDLNDTGDHYSSIMAKIEANFVTIFSTDPKTRDLKKKYSEDIYGLSDQFQTKYNMEVVLPVLLFNIKKKLNVY